MRLQPPIPMKHALACAAVTLAACSDAPPVVLEVANESSHAIDAVQFSAGPEPMGAFSDVAPGDQQSQTVPLPGLAGQLSSEFGDPDGRYTLSGRRADGADLSMSIGSVWLDQPADTIRLRVYDDSLVVDMRQGEWDTTVTSGLYAP